MKYLILFSFIIIGHLVKAIDIYKQTAHPNISFTNIIADSDSSAILIGNETDSTYSHYRAVIIRVNLNGDVLWSKFFDDSHNVVFNQLVLNSDSSKILIAGETRTTFSTYTEGLLIEMDHNGNIIWEKRYKNPNENWTFTSISNISPTTISISATRADTNYTAGTVLIADTAGIVFKATGFISNGEYGSTELLQNGKLYVTGYSFDVADEVSDAFVMKVDTSFTQTFWSTKYLFFNRNDQAKAGLRSMILDNEGLLFSHAGYSWLSEGNYNSAMIDSSGNVLWLTNHGPAYTRNSDGDILFANDSYGQSNSLITKIDVTGNIITNFSESTSTLQSYGICSLGNTIISNTLNGFYIFDSIPCIAPVIDHLSDTTQMFPPVPGFQISSAPYVLNIVSGQLIEFPGPTFSTQCISAGIAENKIPSFEIYPNPASGVVSISSEANIRTIKIFNQPGESILFELVNSKNHTIDLSSLPSGLYFIKCESDNNSFSKIILKN